MKSENSIVSCFHFQFPSTVIAGSTHELQIYVSLHFRCRVISSVVSRAAAAVASRAQEKLIRGPLMAQQKRAQQGQDDKSICILWMDERGEGGMDARNILPRCASTPCAYTWPDVEARRGWHDWACLKRKKAFGPRQRKKWREGSRGKERAKLQNLNVLSLYLPLCTEWWRTASPHATEN